MRSLLYAAANSLKRRNLGVMLDKVRLRVTEKDESRQAAAWCAERAEDWDGFARNLDSALYEESVAVCAALEKQGRAKLDALGLDLGGGGHYPLLYFLTRSLRARTVVETGVAAGWSSASVLSALKANGTGHLYSSDFPYFRLKDPEKYIGFVVPDELKDSWTLMIDGDRNNLPAIAARAESVDLFHYDSDKSYAGRAFAWETLKPRMAPGAAIIFDDIQDNFHFRDWAAAEKRPYKIFSFGGKYVGAAGMMFNN